VSFELTLVANIITVDVSENVLIVEINVNFISVGVGANIIRVDVSENIPLKRTDGRTNRVYCYFTPSKSDLSLNKWGFHPQAQIPISSSLIF
jgi:hypothetical protein